MKKKLIIAFIIIIILFTHNYNYFQNSENDYVYSDLDEINLNEPIHYSYTNQKIEQKIVAKDNNFYKIKLFLNGTIESFDDYDELYWNVKLKDDDGTIIEEYNIQKIYLEQDGSVPIQFSPIKDSIGKTYYLEISSYHLKNLKLTLGSNSKEDCQMKINNSKTNYSLIFQTAYKSTKSNVWYYVLTVTITIIFSILYFILSKKNIKLEKQYLLLSIVISLLMIFLTPPYGGSDESSHFARIYELSKGKIISDTTDGWPTSLVPDINNGFSKYSDITLESKMSVNKEVDMQYTSVYSVISYIPQTLGMLISRIFLPQNFWIYLTRIFQAIFCILCIYYSIKIIPYGKNMIFLIGMIPSVLKATTLLSADACLISAIILYLAKILQLSQKNKIEKKDYIVLCITSCVIALSKLVYLPLIFILLCLFIKRKDMRKGVIIIITISILVTFFWNIIALKNLTSGQGINTAYYVQQIIKNPIQFIQITTYSLFQQIGNHISDLFGGENSWHADTIYDSTILPVAFFVLYLYYLFHSESRLDTKEKWFLCFLMMFTFLLISTSIYISCTPIYSKEIKGIQGRYFIPFLPYIYLCNSSNQKETLKLPNILTLIYYIYFLNMILVYL